MELLTAVIDKVGRILIPARIRRELCLRPGVRIVLIRDGGKVHISTPAMALKEAQDRIARLVPRKVSLADELIAERRKEARRESEA
jgi:AbrB family looped-hinge helix DNA binding protein